jgi:hypothetical protein
MGGIVTTPLFDLSAEVDTPLDLRGDDGTGRFIGPVLGGTFSGPRMRGKVLPVGADWLTTEEGYGKIDVRLVLETEDDALIYMTYRGIHTIGPSVRERLAAGETVDPSEYYFRTTPLFETAASEYNWLNRIVAVGLGARTLTTVDYRVFEVL